MKKYCALLVSLTLTSCSTIYRSSDGSEQGVSPMSSPEGTVYPSVDRDESEEDSEGENRNAQEEQQTHEEKMQNLSSEITSDPVSKEAKLEEKIKMQNLQINALESKVEELQAALTNRSTLPPLESVRPTLGSISGSKKINDSTQESVRKFQMSLALFESKQFTEAEKGLKEFVEVYPDHIWSGSAHYYLGKIYAEKKEWLEAKKEFEMVLSKYSYSARVSDSLKEISEVEEKLGNASPADLHKQVLLSTFPQSPASESMMQENNPEESNDE